MPKLLLRKIDPTTECFVDEATFAVDDIKQICDMLGIVSFQVGTSFRIDGHEYTNIVTKYDIEIDLDATVGEILHISENSARYVASHTGRELLLMLQGKKPFAAFSDTYPSACNTEIIPERAFEPYVIAGRIDKFTSIQSSNSDPAISIRRVLYSAPGEAWRAQAYLSLWKLAEKYGWNPKFEKIEGFLLGYEPDIDDYFKSSEIKAP